MIFARTPGDHRLFIEDIVWCGAGDYRCTRASVDWRRLHGKGGAAIYWEPFRQTEVKKSSDGSLVAGATGEGGAYGVRLAPLDAGENSVVIAFEVQGDVPVTLRRRRDGEFSYLDSDRGFIVLRAADRALLYSETPGRFEVKITESFPCATSKDWRCRTKEEFLALLPPEREPGSIEGMLDLLAWVTRHSDFAESANIQMRFAATGLAAHEIYFKYLEGSIAAGYCSAQATFLSRLLQERGYRAFTLNFGVLNDHLTHVTTIVAADDQFFLLDATFGFFLADELTGTPISLLEALDGAPTRFLEFSAPNRDFLWDKTDPRYQKELQRGAVTKCEAVAGNIVRCSNPTFGASSNFQEWSAALVRNNLPVNEDAFLELIKRGFFGVSHPDWPEAQRLVAEFVKRGVPFVQTDSAGPTAALVNEATTRIETGE